MHKLNTETIFISKCSRYITDYMITTCHIFFLFLLIITLPNINYSLHKMSCCACGVDEALTIPVNPCSLMVNQLTHWGRVTHICVSKLTTIGSDNDLSPGRRQAINWTSAGILLIGTLGTNFSEILSEIRALSFKKMELKMSYAKWRRFCLGLNVLRCCDTLSGSEY